MSVACDQAAGNAAGGVAAALRAVDCIAGETTAQAFGRMFAPGGALLTVLTILLTLYVAFFAISLLLGRSGLGVRSLTPRMILLGLVLTFVTSWVAYSRVVWNLAIGGPDELATIITGAQGSATQVFAQKIDVVFAAIQQAGQGGKVDVSAFSPEGMMWLGAMLFLLGTVGVLVTARIALAVLVALGPIFVVMALFDGTRGLFTGWLKGVVMLAITPLFAVLAGSVMLELAVPVLAALVATPGQIDPQAAMAFFLIGAVHVALMIMVLKVAGTMVSGWRVFGLVPEKGADGRNGYAAPVSHVPATVAPVQATAAQATSGAAERRIPVSAFATAPAANDSPSAGGVGRRDTVVINQAPASASGQQRGEPSSISRARGIGSRFRAPAPRKTENVK
ncbi:type IV secretion system protein [Tsuneonella flava]|uniref:Type IV secretion system protein n=1 Tax=Tsuneonella flava TaxID=2055955 RepID=A0ABX7K883_9SPHN|nr:type IV secretion system protein [Tsuneonella flava]QSB44430.1 type IV secretion system protein [Tsuneonella flava]